MQQSPELGTSRYNRDFEDLMVVFVYLVILLMHLIVLVGRSGSNTKYFSFELAPYPKTLFKDHLTRHPKRSLLADVLKIKQSRHNGKKEEVEGYRYEYRGREHQ